ncbi:alkaline phosphatase family protein [Natronosalvus vescus]|uniref:alkaline phosphatase family protein n=1 Tax=Natronosalvus vescus TaxID=2953881 RepID=UPI002090984D|nr:alkaline phosphatase family protein [Natronosalvus vescus]
MTVVVFAFEGLDEASLERFAPDVPTIADLRERGVSGTLEPTVPATPASVWTSVVTGTDPSYHGIFDETTAEGYPGAGRPVSAIDVRRPTLWDYLTGEGANTIVCGLPLTDPPGPMNGVVVPGRTAGDSSAVALPVADPADDESPPPFQESRRGTIPNASDTGLPAGRPWTVADLEGPAELPSLIDARRRLSVDLLDTEPWELAIVHVPVADPSGRLPDGTTDTSRAIYRAADRLVASVLETVPDETTVVGCSPLGAPQPVEYRVHVNELLAANGLLEREPKRGSGTGSGLVPSLESLLATASSAFSRATSAFSRISRMFGRASMHHHRNDEDWTSAYQWGRSLAFCPSASGAGVRLNVAGRERYGRVVNSAYEETRAAVLEALRDCRDPDGNPAFEFACNREHLYDGPFVREAPDVICSTARTACTLAPEPGRRSFTPAAGATQPGPGTFFAAGPAIRENGNANENGPLTAADIAPLVIAALGRPVPTLMTGSVPEEVVRGAIGYGTYTTVAHGTVLTDPTFDDALLGDHLEEFDYR